MCHRTNAARYCPSPHAELEALAARLAAVEAERDMAIERAEVAELVRDQMRERLVLRSAERDEARQALRAIEQDARADGNTWIVGMARKGLAAQPESETA
jgi:hypothetical protein